MDLVNFQVKHFDIAKANTISPTKLQYSEDIYTSQAQQRSTHTQTHARAHTRMHTHTQCFTPIVLMYRDHHLVLLDKDCPDLCCHHGDNRGDVIFESVREAASSGDIVLVKVRHMLRHAFHLVGKRNKKTTHPINVRLKPTGATKHTAVTRAQ